MGCPGAVFSGTDRVWQELGKMGRLVFCLGLGKGDGRGEGEKDERRQERDKRDQLAKPHGYHLPHCHRLTRAPINQRHAPA